MYFSVLVVAFLAVVLLHDGEAAWIPVIPFNKSHASHRSMSELGLESSCGSTGWCPLSYPICCLGSNAYCVTAGEKCCNSLTGEYNSCRQDQVCCPLGDSPICCNEGEACGSNGQCLTNACSKHTQPEMCLADSSCGWCCNDRRCASRGLPYEIMCGSGPQITGAGSICPDTCSYALTCGQCGQLSDCAWCCDQQACIAKTLTKSYCNPYERIDMNGNASLVMSECDSCLGFGQGLFQETISPFQQYSGIFAVIGSLCFLVAIGTLVRYLMVRRMQQQMFAELSTIEIRRVMVAVRRYGFRALPEGDHDEATVPPAAQTRTQPSAEGQSSPADRQVQPNAQDDERSVPVEIPELCRKCKQRLAAPPLSSPSCPRDADGSNSEATQDYVVMLPCKDAVCLRCLEIPQILPAASSGAQSPPVSRETTAPSGSVNAEEQMKLCDEEVPQSEADGAVTAKRELSAAATERLILKKLRAVCPCCSEAVDDVFQVKKLFRSSPGT